MAVNNSEAQFFKQLAHEAELNPPLPIEKQTVADLRSGANLFLKYAGLMADVTITDEFITARDSYQIPIRIFNSDLTDKQPVLIIYPGCGFVLDLFETNSISCSRIAKYSGIKVILVNFRLAPENPLPIPIYDAYDATKHIALNANKYNIDANKIFIGGLSSGAHCAAVVTNLAKSDKDFKIFHQVLINSTYSLIKPGSTYDEYEKEDKILTRETVDLFMSYWGVKPEDYKNPLFSPLYTKDLSGLPNTTIIVGEYDGVRNDSEAYYIKLKQAGNKCEKILLSGQTHNTMVMRDVMTDGEDPAQVVAKVIKANS